jgi:hypothetical protein
MKNMVNNYCHVIKDFITAEEQRLLQEKAENHFRQGRYTANPAGPHRYMTSLEKPPEYDEIVEQINRKIIKAFGLEGYPVEPVLNRLISRIEPGGFIHNHDDKLRVIASCYPDLYRNLDILDKENYRCNIMVQMANKSAHPIIAGRPVEVSTGDAWGFLASRWEHGTQVITGGTRIIYGFGFIVPKNFKSRN